MNRISRSIFVLVCFSVVLKSLSGNWVANAVATTAADAVGAPIADNLDGLEQAAFQAAVQAVAGSVVQIRTVGGLDRIGKTLIAQGPTTGLIVSADGYIVSSVFNFARQPSSILVRLPGGKQVAAELVARDKNRMLVLLKVEIDSSLPVPVHVPTDKIKVGNWAIALGRTFRADRVGVSTGIISGRNRMYGRVVQTDASVSVANYGGPLIDLRGRVFGILVPMAPQAGGQDAESELAGAETYDSGIGFAVPLEHVFSLLPRWREGADLLPGKLGIGLVAGSPQLEPPQITSVWAGSPAAEAGWQAGDLITAINGQPISTQAHLRFQILPRYAGDTLSATLQRGEESLETSITLAGRLAPFQHPFLGVLPDRAAPGGNETGVLVRSVWPSSPAAAAGLRAGDRLLKINTAQLTGLDDALKEMNRLHPAEDVQLTLLRHNQELQMQAHLTSLPEEIIAADELSGAPRAEQGESPTDIDTDAELDATANADPPQLKPLRAAALFEVLKLPTFSQEASVYAPEIAKGQRAGLLVWLSRGTPEYAQHLLTRWQTSCQQDHIVLLVAHPQEESRWMPSDLDFLNRLIRTARARFAPDPQRTVVGGAGKAGQLALALALKQPQIFGGAIGLDAPLPRSLTIPRTGPNHRLAILAVESHNSSFAPLLRQNVQQLRAARYPVSWLQVAPSGEVEMELDSTTQNQMARWIDGLDRF